MNEWMNEWVNEWMSECVNEWMNEWMIKGTWQYVVVSSGNELRKSYHFQDKPNA